MSTLFHLHSGLDNHLESGFHKLNCLFEQGDAVILMGQTLGFLNLIFIGKSIDTQDFDTQEFDTEGITCGEKSFDIIANFSNLYALKSDFSSLNATSQDKLRQLPVFSNIQLIDDGQWIGLTEGFNRLVTVSS